MTVDKKNKKNYLYFVGIFLAIFLLKSFSNGFLFGYRTTFVLTESMVPDIPVGSILLEQVYDKEEKLFPDDIITFIVRDDFNSTRITHRIVKIDGERLYSKGDANQEVDEWFITYSDVEGKVVFIYPYTFQTLSVIALILFNFLYLQKRNIFSNVVKD